MFQDFVEQEEREVARKERERLKQQDKMKRQRLDEVRAQQNALAAHSEV